MKTNFTFFLLICLLTSSITMAVPKITSFSPTSGTIGTTVTITGTGFSTTPASNIVYFGAVKAVVSASSATSITVTVPAGAGSVVPITVTVSSLVAYSLTSSTPYFNLTNTPNLVPQYTNSSTLSVGDDPQAVAIGDFNNDGIADIAAVNFYDNTVSIMLGKGDGTFAAATKVVVGSYPIAIAIGDFNGDGKADIVTANYFGNNVSVLLGNGNGTFAAAKNTAVGSFPYSVAVGDFNGDGKTDIVTANSGANNVSILLGTGTGTFSAAKSYAVGLSPYSVVVGDFNGDGKADIATANFSGNNISVLLGTGTGTFGAATSFAVGASPSSLVIGDFNGDGKADIATANSVGNNVSILLGTGTGSFAAASTYAVGSDPESIAIGDFNGDGIIDLITANFGSDNVSMMLGNGNGTFAAANNISMGTGSGPSSVAVGDFNGDGKADFTTADYNMNSVSVMLYTSGAAPMIKKGSIETKSDNNINIYPNPFVNNVDINYSLIESGSVKIALYNTVGQRINTLVDEYQANGNYKYSLNTSDLPTGVYTCEIVTPNYHKVVKILKAK